MPTPTVSSVMTRGVVTIRPDTPFKDIVALLNDKGISAVPVTDDDGRLLGVVSESDLLAKEEYRSGLDRAPTLLSTRDPEERCRRAEGRTAADVMTPGVACVREDDPVVAVARRLAEANVRRMFVVDESGSLVGVVARRDLLRLYLRPDERIRDDVRALLDEIAASEASAIEVRVELGVVALLGRAPSRVGQERVVRAVRALPGVVGVRNQLIPGQGVPSSPAEAAPTAPATATTTTSASASASARAERAGGGARAVRRPEGRVVAGISGAEEDDAKVVAWAAEEAARRGLPLHLVHVYAAMPYAIPVTLGGPLPPVDDLAVREAGRVALDHAARQVRAAHPALGLTAELASGRPDLALREESARAAMLVLGARRHGALAEVVLGSMAGDMSVSATCPVVAVPVDRPPAPRGGPVVVGVNDAATATDTLRFAFAEASSRGAELHAVHCLATPSTTPGGEGAERDEHERSLAGVITAVAEGYPDVRAYSASVPGDAVPELLHRSEDASLLVVGTHGRHRVGAAVLGSVSRALLRSAECPVAVVRPTH
ncbi:CBS-domain-containing membrane protein [Streptoalloteichus tenebrarius]|uniref:CBS-domain-containing membrane protein n=1 Tax=Streptoalloteichus tenebrarius (strain ATCC 17920 / DSM 40477 / JCM 4838 / CBS 697.72 / NBRC 16177 / NCIMB 11028 / NRRL B-12390 / A12253. 1 / ISP 5477) TaxID=1933 RepID=A0ABT1HZM0_STRSD|nr:universal stress protein [Streptoalloteichus tenebrarius]MCP2260982.1 CBS-domain-containing membrane protein [Streptoalloteichus tenebrarius]BFE98921.1 hypothetical protein GCM10020241_05970 [Streptoalloteichus tenebrarius]